MTQRPRVKNITEFDSDLVLFEAQNSNEEPITMSDMAATIAQYALAAQTSKNNIKEQDVRLMCKVDNVTWNTILTETNRRLEHSFGYKIVREDKFLVVANIMTRNAYSDQADLQTDARRGFLHIILAYILMERHPCCGSAFGKVGADKIWQFLKELGIEAKSPDKYLGDIPQLFSYFLKEGWLALTKEIDGRKVGDDIHYEWGEKAKASISPMDMLQSFCELNGKQEPELLWKAHYDHIEKMEEEFRQNRKDKRMNRFTVLGNNGSPSPADEDDSQPTSQQGEKNHEENDEEQPSQRRSQRVRRTRDS